MKSSFALLTLLIFNIGIDYVVAMEVFIRVEREYNSIPVSEGRGFSVRQGINSFVIAPKHVVYDATSISFFENKIEYPAKNRYRFGFNETDSLKDVKAISALNDYTCLNPTIMNCENINGILQNAHIGCLRIALKDGFITKKEVSIKRHDDYLIRFTMVSPKDSIGETMSGSTLYLNDSCFVGMLVAIHGDTGIALRSDKLFNLIDIPEAQLSVVAIIDTTSKIERVQYESWISEFSRLLSETYHFRVFNSKSPISIGKTMQSNSIQEQMRICGKDYGTTNIAALKLTVERRKISGTYFFYKSGTFISENQNIRDNASPSNTNTLIADLAGLIAGTKTESRKRFEISKHQRDSIDSIIAIDLKKRLRIPISGGLNHQSNSLQYSNFYPVRNFFKSEANISQDFSGGYISTAVQYRFLPEKPFWVSLDFQYNIFPITSYYFPFTFPLEELDGLSTKTDSVHAAAHRTIDREERWAIATQGVSFSYDYPKRSERFKGHVSLSPKLAYATSKISQLTTTVASGELFSSGIYSGNVYVESQTMTKPVLHGWGGGVEASNVFSYKIWNGLSACVDIGYSLILLGKIRQKFKYTNRMDIVSPKGRWTPIIINDSAYYGYGTADYFGTGEFIDFCRFDSLTYKPDGSTADIRAANKELSYLRLGITLAWTFK